MIKGLISGKVRQSVPKTPAKRCSPRKDSSGSVKRGPKPVSRPEPPVVHSEVIGIPRDRFPGISAEAWNALTSNLRDSVLALLRQLDSTLSGKDADIELLNLLEEGIPEWAYRIGRGVTEAVLVDQSGHLGNRLECDQCGNDGLRFRDYRSLTANGILGTIELSRARYRCDCCGHTAYPLDQQLGLVGEHKMFPRLQESIARMSAKTSYPDALETLQDLLPARFCLRTQENVTHTVAGLAREEQQREVDRAFSKPGSSKLPDPTGAIPPGSFAAVAVDGGFCRMRDKEEPFREFKMGVLGTFSAKPRQSPKEPPPEVEGKHYVGTFRGADFLMGLTLLESHRMGLGDAKVIQFIGDGADWIWNRAHYFQNGDQELVQTLDLYHAREYLAETANAFFGQGTDKATAWYRARDTELLAGNFRSFFLAFTLLAKKATNPELKELVQKNRNYFDVRRKLLNYRECLERGLLVGSGMIEGGIRFVGKDRLHRTGMRWSEPGAEDILHLRALHASNRWSDFSSHQAERRKQEFRRLKSTWLSAA